MIKLGQYNKLMVIKEVPFGVYLDGKEYGEILLPKKYVPKNACVSDIIQVFIYFDSNDQIIATTQKPYAEVGKFAFLKVIDVNPIGAFLDWGLDKDLLAPRPEQKKPMEKGRSYLVFVKQDNQERIIASSKLDYFLDKLPADYLANEPVELIIAQKSDLGFKVIINQKHWGLLHSSDVFQNLRIGQFISGFIKKVREDGKLDVVIRKPCSQGRVLLAEQILNELEKSDGFLPFHDKSSAEEIREFFGESKKRFKDTIGQLYKQGKILIEENGIKLIKKP